MIHYTLSGPQHILEIHDDKICLHKRFWAKLFSLNNKSETWSLDDLSRFQVTEGENFFLAKLEWESFDGHRGLFHFSTHTEFVKKIEKYFQKRILKNYLRLNVEEAQSTEPIPEAGPKDKFQENRVVA